MLTFSEPQQKNTVIIRDLIFNGEVIGEWYVLRAMQPRYGNFSLNEAGKKALGLSHLWLPNCNYYEAFARICGHLKARRDCDLLVQNSDHFGLYELYDLENDLILFTGTMEQCYYWKEIIEAHVTNGG